MSSLRLAIVSILSLCVGVVIGYWIRPAPMPSAAPAAPKPAAAMTSSAPQPAAASSIAANEGEKSPAAMIGGRSPSLRERLAFVRWQRSVGPTQAAHLFSGKGINLTLVKYLDLTPDEQARLTAASRIAEAEVNRLRDASATSRSSADGKQLIVEVPGLDAATSRAIYDRFNAEIAATLDPDRLELLNLLTGESTEILHDRFGLNSIRYELTFAPRRLPDGRIFYDYRRHFVDADGTSRGWSDSNQSLEDIAKTAPTLARFFTAAQSATPKP
jgi:hypothetical protein